MVNTTHLYFNTIVVISNLNTSFFWSGILVHRTVSSMGNNISSITQQMTRTRHNRYDIKL